MYDQDQRLIVKIVEKAPRIEITNIGKSLPVKVVAGEIIEFHLEVKNIGNLEAKNVWINSNQG